MAKGADEFARGRIPEPGGVTFAFAVRIRAPSGLNAPYHETYNLGIGQGGDELARGRIPELGGFVLSMP